MLVPHLFRAVAATFLVSAVLAKEYDYIVVGAGPSGSIVSSQLAKQGAHVLLLEAGGDNTDPALDSMFQYFSVAFNTFNYGYLQWGYQTTPQPLAGAGAPLATNKTIGLPRGRVLGGCDSINAAAYVQGNAEDFNKIATTLGDSSWSWSKLQSFRAQLEATLGITKLGTEQSGAPDFIANAQEVLGIPFNPNSNNGNQYGIAPSFWTAHPSPAGGVRNTAFDKYVRPLVVEPSSSNQGSIDVITSHLVEKLIFDDADPTRVIGVSCFNLRAQIPIEFQASKEVILSAGTYNSPQILMLAGIGPQDHLTAMGIPVKKALPGVGSNLRDHYSVATFWKLESLPQVSPFLFVSPSLNMFGPEPIGQTSYQFELSGNFGSVVALRQESTGTVRLSSSDPKDKVVINPNVLSTPNDVQGLVNGLKTILLPFFQGLINKGLVSQGSISPSATDAELKAYVLNNVESSHHASGTCKVGKSSDPMAVVDKNFLVMGMSNLRVIDASVFPKVPSGNTNASTMTTAYLGASKILKKSYSRLLRGA
jgi:choline dehydrogenase